MKTLIFVLVVLASICQNFAQQAMRKIVLKVNLGGGPVGDFLGEDQVLETDGLHKATTDDQIQNTDQNEIFQSQRFARDEDFVMRIPVPDGIYSVTLLFAETYEKACTPGGRTFDISLGTPISGVIPIFKDFDIFQAAGCKAAHGKRFDKVPSKEGIIVHLRKKSQHPSLAGFVVEGYPVPKGDGSEYRAVGQIQPAAGTAEMNQGMLATPPLSGQAAGQTLGLAEVKPLEGQQSAAVPPERPQLQAPNPAGNSPVGSVSMVNPPLATNERPIEDGQGMVGLQPGRVASDITQTQGNMQFAGERRAAENIPGQSQVTVRPEGLLPQQRQVQPTGTVGILE